MPQILFRVRIFQRNIECGKMNLVKSISGVAHAGDLRRILDSRRDRRKVRAHLFFRLDIKVLGRHLHAVRIAHSLSGLHTKKHFVRFRIFFIHIVAVVRRDQRDAGLIGQHDQVLVHLRLIRHLVALDLEVVVASSEDSVIPQCGFFCFFGFVSENIGRDFTGYTGRKCDQAFRVFLQKLVIDPRFIVEAFGKAGRDQAVQVLQAFVILRQEHQMVVAAVFGFFQETPSRRDIHFTADDRVDTLFGHRFIEFDRAVHRTVVRDRTRSHAQFFEPGSETLDADRTIQKTVFRM